MENRIVIKNEQLQVEISTHGAEMKSITDSKGNARLWSGDPAVWAGQAPIMWPICGGLKDDKFSYKGKSYALAKHGFGRLSDFECEKSSSDCAVFLLKSDEKSKGQFPFDYELRVIYQLVESSIRVTYRVTNTTDGEMYFSVGGHEAYACPEGVEAYSVIFEKEEVLDRVVLDGNFLTNETERVLDKGRELKLKNKFFEDDALVFTNLKSRSVRLVNNKTGSEIQVDFGGFDYFLIWTIPGAKYVCLEPWTGIPDYVDAGGDISGKEGITRLDKNGEYEVTHTITIK